MRQATRLVQRLSRSLVLGQQGSLTGQTAAGAAVHGESLCLGRGLATSAARAQKTWLDERASEGEGSPYAEARGGLKQHGEAHNIVFSEEHANISNEIEKALQLAAEEGGVDAVFQVVESFGEGAEFNEMNVATAFLMVERAARERGLGGAELAERVHQHPRFQNLVDMALATSCNMTNKEISEVLVSSGRLGFEDQMLLDRLTERLVTSIPSLEPAQLVDAVEGLQGADHSPSKVLFDELKHRADELGDRLTPEQRRKLKEGYNHFGYTF